MADRIGELLVRENLISLAQLKRAQADQRTTGKRLSYSLSRLGILGERELADFLSAQYGVPWMSLTDYEIDPKVVELARRDAERIEAGSERWADLAAKGLSVVVLAAQRGRAMPEVWSSSARATTNAYIIISFLVGFQQLGIKFSR